MGQSGNGVSAEVAVVTQCLLSLAHTVTGQILGYQTTQTSAKGQTPSTGNLFPENNLGNRLLFVGECAILYI